MPTASRSTTAKGIVNQLSESAIIAAVTTRFIGGATSGAWGTRRTWQRSSMCLAARYNANHPWEVRRL